MPSLAAYILDMNEDGTTFPINLAGMGIGDGLTDPAVQDLAKPKAAFNFGLINRPQLKEALTYARLAANLTYEGDYIGALNARGQLEGVIKQASGINMYDVRTFTSYASIHATIDKWANDPANIAMLNLSPGSKFDTPDEVYYALEDDIMKSSVDKVREVVVVVVVVVIVVLLTAPASFPDDAG